MPSPKSYACVQTPTRVATLALAALVTLPMAGCKNGGRGRKSEAAKWIENPSPGVKEGEVIRFPDLGVKFEIPDTLYVYRQCGEAGHSATGSEKWIPLITCQSTSGGGFQGFGEMEEEDPFAAEDMEEETGVEQIDLTLYVTPKTRPLDERSVAWFENSYKQAGLDVDEISYQHDYQKKAGIYAKLHIVDDEGTPTREIVQFLFPRDDVVYVARMEYPFGETRSVDADWQYILWNFDFVGPGESSASTPPPAEAQAEAEGE